MKYKILIVDDDKKTVFDAGYKLRSVDDVE